MISFGVGTGFLLIIGLAALMTGDGSLIFKISGGVGIGAFLISALFSGTLFSGTILNGDRNRANWRTEFYTGKKSSQGWASMLFLFGLPNFLGALAYILWGM